MAAEGYRPALPDIPLRRYLPVTDDNVNGTEAIPWPVTECAATGTVPGNLFGARPLGTSSRQETTAGQSFLRIPARKVLMITKNVSAIRSTATGRRKNRKVSNWDVITTCCNARSHSGTRMNPMRNAT